MEKKGTGGFSGKKNSVPGVISDQDKAAVDLFYEKIYKLNESSGLSLIFNFRKTMLDLHRFYKEVIKHGGFYQVTRKGKWDDIASAKNLNSSVIMSATQLQNVYEMLVLQYELMYCRTTPDQANLWPDKSSQGLLYSRVNPFCPTGKRKHFDFSSPGYRHGLADKREHGLSPANKNSSIMTLQNSSDKELTMDTEAPVKPQTAYQIFLRLETRTLKKIHGESSNTQNLRELALRAWRSLPKKDRLPYIQASKMDKERYGKEMAAYMHLRDNQNAMTKTLFHDTTPSMLNFSTSSEIDDVYHVSLEGDTKTLHSPDESMVELAIEVMKNAEPDESIFQIDLDNGSMD